MRILKSLGLLVIVFSMLAAVGPAFAAKAVTVGDFVQEVARVKGVNATDAQLAADALAAVGVRLPADLDYDKRLTESDVTRLSRVLGLKVTSSNPDQPFDDDQLERFFLAFGDDLGAGAGDDDYETRSGATPGGESGSSNGNGPPFNPYTKGKGGSKGKKKGHGPLSPTEPE